MIFLDWLVQNFLNFWKVYLCLKRENKHFTQKLITRCKIKIFAMADINYEYFVVIHTWNLTTEFSVLKLGKLNYSLFGIKIETNLLV